MDKSLADQTKLTNAKIPVKITIFIGHFTLDTRHLLDKNNLSETKYKIIYLNLLHF